MARHVRTRNTRRNDHGELRFGGGLNENDIFAVTPEECLEGFNFRLNSKGRSLRPRAPQDLKGTAPNAGAITGIMQLIQRDDAVTQLIVAGNAVYDWDGASVFSDVTPPIFTSGASGTRLRSSHWPLDDVLVITDLDLVNPLYKWDGTEVSRLKTDLTVGSPGSVTGVTGGSTTATVVETAHGYATGDLVTIAGANQAEFNTESQVSVQSDNGFTYTTSATVTTDTATGTLTSDKGTELFAKYSRCYNSRVWLFNIKADSTETPHMILASAFEDGEDFDNAVRGVTGGMSANDPFFLLVPDLRPINGVQELVVTDGEQLVSTLVISTTDGKLFRLNGSDATDYAFIEFYAGSGTGGQESIVNVGNDLIFLRKGNVIESLRSTQQFGDIGSDDISRWIPTTAKRLSAPISVYDQSSQSVFFFDAAIDGVLVLDKDTYELGPGTEAAVANQKELSPWTIYKTGMANQFHTQAATALRIPTSTSNQQTVYWGDDAGQIFDMNGTGIGGDAGTTTVNVVRTTRFVADLNTRDELMIGRVEYQRTSAFDLELTFDWADEYNIATVIVPLKASFGVAAIFWGNPDNYWGAANYWNAGRVVDQQISNMGFSAPGKGTGFKLALRMNTTANFLISRIYL